MNDKTLKELKQEEREYVMAHGGYYELTEFNQGINDINKEQIKAFKSEFGVAYLGKINYYDDERIKVISGEMPILNEYHDGDIIYNFGCAFCVPCEDEVLINMIKEWNKPIEGKRGDILNEVGRIYNRIAELKGLSFIWT